MKSIFFALLLTFAQAKFYYEKTRFDRSINDDYGKYDATQNSHQKIWTYIDTETNYIAYKDKNENTCFLEKIKSYNPARDLIQNILRPSQPKVLYAGTNDITKYEAWKLVGRRITNFCHGRKFFLLDETKPDLNEISQPFKNELSENIIVPQKLDVFLTPHLRRTKREDLREEKDKLNDIISRNRKKRQAQPFRGRFRGQTQSQYLNVGGEDQKEGKAEAEATHQSSHAIVTGSHGMGQAQSMSSGGSGCEDCPGYGGQISGPTIERYAIASGYPGYYYQPGGIPQDVERKQDYRFYPKEIFLGPFTSVIPPGGAPIGGQIPPGVGVGVSFPGQPGTYPGTTIPGVTQGGVYPGGGAPGTGGGVVQYPGGIAPGTGGGGVQYPGGVGPGTGGGGVQYPGGIAPGTGGGGVQYPGGIAPGTGGGGVQYPGGVGPGTGGGGVQYPGGVAPGTGGGGVQYPGGVAPGTGGGGVQYPGGIAPGTGGGAVQYPGSVAPGTGGGGVQYPGGVGPGTGGGGVQYPGGVAPGTGGGGVQYPGGVAPGTGGGGVQYPGGIAPGTGGGAVQYPGGVAPGTGGGGVQYPGGVAPGTGGGGVQYPGGIAPGTGGGGVQYPGGVAPGTGGVGVQYPGGVAPGTGGRGVQYPGGVAPGTGGGGVQYPGGVVPGIGGGGVQYPGGVAPGIGGGGVQYPGGIAPGTGGGGVQYPGGVAPGIGGGGVQYPGGVAPGIGEGGVQYPGGVVPGTGGGVVQYPGGVVPGGPSGTVSYPGGVVPGTGTIPGGSTGTVIYPGTGGIVPGTGVGYPSIYPGGVVSGSVTAQGQVNLPGGVIPGQGTSGSSGVVYPGVVSGGGGGGGAVQPGGVPGYPEGTSSGIGTYPGGTVPGTGIYPGGSTATGTVMYPGGTVPGTGTYPGSGTAGYPGQYPGSGTAGYPGQYPGSGTAGYPGQYPGQIGTPGASGTGVSYPIPGGQYPSNEPAPYVIPEPGSADDDADSQASSSVKQGDNGTEASAQAEGKFGRGTAQSQVSGVYTGSGSFSAQAGSSDDVKSAQTQVSGGKEGATSNAQGRGGHGKSQVEVSLNSDTGATSTSAQSSGWKHGTTSQVQASSKGGMADAQANGEGNTSSQAQIGFQPYQQESGKPDKPTNPFHGGGTASAQSGTHRGQSQSQLQGSFQYGITYTGAAQAGSGSGAAASRKPFNFSNTDSEIFKTFKPYEPPVISKTEDSKPNIGPYPDQEQDLEVNSNSRKTVNNNPKKNRDISRKREQTTIQTEVDDTLYDGNNNEEYDEEYDDEYYNSPISESSSRKSTEIRQRANEQSRGQSGQVQQIKVVTEKHHNARVLQNSNLREGDILESGTVLPGYTIPPGFRGRVTSVSGRDTFTHGDGKSQSQTVSLTNSDVIRDHKTSISGTKSLQTSHERNFATHSYNHGYQFIGSDKSQPLAASKSSHVETQKPNYYTVTNSVAGKIDDNRNNPKYEHRYYTKSSTCGYFTFSCNIVYGSNGRTKICKPKAPTYPDGTPLRC